MRIGSALVLGLLGGAVVAIGRVFGLLEMYVIGTGLAATAVAAVVATVSRIVLISVARGTSNNEPSVGDLIDVDVTLKAIRRSPGFEFSDFIADSSQETTGRVDISVPPLRRGQQTVSRYRLRAERRGTITLGPAIVEHGDPLGLASRTTTTGLVDEIVVSPLWTPIDLPVVRSCEGRLVTAIEGLTRNSAAAREFKSLRDYAPGDDARSVNWRATARRDSLVVNEYESLSGILLDVFLDDVSSTYSTEGFERAVSIAASFVGSAPADDDEVRVRLSLGSRADSTAFDAVIDRASRHDAMRVLARLQVKERESQPLCRSDRTLVPVPIIICGTRDAAWIENAHRALRGSSVGVVIGCDGHPAPPMSPTWFHLRIDYFSDFERAWAQLCRRISVS